MIQINLLPPEYHRSSGTPGVRFVAIIVGLVAVLATGGFYAYTHFIELVNVREMRDARQSETAAKERLRDRSAALQKEIETYVKRRRAIQTINRSRTLWSKKLDQFFDIVTSHGGDNPIVAWLESINVPTQVASSGSNRRPSSRAGKKGTAQLQSAGKLEITGSIAVDENTDGPAVLASLHKAITGDLSAATNAPSDFFQDFNMINNPNLAMERAQEDSLLLPPHRGTFKLDMSLKPINLDVKATPAMQADLEEIEDALWDDNFTFSEEK